MPPKKKIEPEKNPAEAAAEEALAGTKDAEGDEIADDALKIEFRGEPFTIPRSRLAGRINLLLSFNRVSDAMAELIGFDRRDQDRLISTLGPDDTLTDIIGEFFAAVNAQTGVGNS